MIACSEPMLATQRIRTPLPPRPASVTAALDATHRLLAALIDGDASAAAALLVPSACVWWAQSSGLSSVDGPPACARALGGLLEAAPPTRLAVVSSGPSSTVTSAYADETLAWSLEIRVGADGITGAFLRGARLSSV